MGNEAALGRYLSELDAHEGLKDAQREIEDSILEWAEAGASDPGNIWSDDEFAEIVTEIKAHRESGGRGACRDWQPDDCAWVFVHGEAE